MHNNAYNCSQMSATLRAHSVSLLSFLLSEGKGSIFFFFLRCFFFLPSNGLKFLTNSLGHSVPESSETGWRTGAKEIWCLHSDSSQAPR